MGNWAQASIIPLRLIVPIGISNQAVNMLHPWYCSRIPRPFSPPLSVTHHALTPSKSSAIATILELFPHAGHLSVVIALWYSEGRV
jgi:hypothetical protein